MIFPSRESEKAISSYSLYLVKSLKKMGLEVTSLNYTAGSYSSFKKILPKLNDFDLIHIQHEYNLLGGYGLPFFLFYLRLRKLKNTKVITTLHTVLPLKEKFGGGIVKTFLRKILYITQNKVIDNCSNKVIVHSDFFVSILTKDYNFKKDKISVIPQGIIEKVPTISKEKAKKELGLNGTVYLVIGNLHKDHGIDKILKNADKIGKTILIVSNPKPINDRKQRRLSKYMDSLFRIVKDNHFEEYVRFDTNSINDKMSLWWKYFSAADFVLQFYREGIGSGIFSHAMASKTPVISSNTSFFRDILKNYDCLKIVNKNSNLGELIKESLKKDNYSKMIKECEKYSNENSWDSLAKKYKEIYLTK